MFPRTRVPEWNGALLKSGMIALVFLIMSASLALAQRRIAEETSVFQAVRDGVFTVFGDRGHGSGFLVDKEGGLVMTNSHVVASSKLISVQLDDTVKVRGAIVAEDADEDIAILVISPQLCLERPELVLAERSIQDLAFEGEKVIAIGSPLNQRRIVTSGIVSRVEEGAIISDVNINPGNSGGPLLNMAEEVIAVNAFRDPSIGGAGISGSIPILKALPVLRQAHERLRDMDSPRPDLLPIAPQEPFPIWGLEWSSKRCYNDRNYMLYEGGTIRSGETWNRPRSHASTPSNFNFVVSTPPRQQYLELWLEEKRRKRQVKAGVAETQLQDPMGNQLKRWREYVGDYAPLVTISIVPKIGETGSSAFWQAMVGTALEFKFKADLQDCQLAVGDSVVDEVFRVFGAMPVSVNLSAARMDDIAQQGVFSYRSEVFCDQMDNILETVKEENTFKSRSEEEENIVLQLHDLMRPERIVIVPFSRRNLEQIWVDFEAYRDMQTARKARLQLPRVDS